MKRLLYDAWSSFFRALSSSVLLCKVCVQLCDKIFRIHVVHHAGHFYGLAAGRRATDAVHADFKELLRGFHIGAKHVNNQSIFCDSHSVNLLFFATLIIYRTAGKSNTTFLVENGCG